MTRDNLIYLVTSILLWGTLLLCALLFTGCKTPQVVTVPEIHTEYIHDTLRMHDSIRIHTREYIKGDTVHKDSVVYRYIYRDKVEIAYKVDSIPYPVEVEKIVTVRSGYDRFCSWAFWIIVACALLAFAWWLFKKIYLRR